MFLYLLQFKNLPSYFKIGITKNVTSRVSTLRNTWGELDYDNSFVVTSPKERSITLLERELHLIFPDDDNFIMEHKGKDGYSEFRSLSHFDECLDIIKVQKHSSLKFSVNSVRNYIEERTPVLKKVKESVTVKKKSILDSIRYYNHLLDVAVHVDNFFENRFILFFKDNQINPSIKTDIITSHTFGVINSTNYDSGMIKSITFKTVNPKEVSFVINEFENHHLYQHAKSEIIRFNKRLDGFNKLDDENVLSLYKDLLSRCNNIHISSECSESMTFELSFKDGITFESNTSIRSVCNNNSNQVIGITYVIMSEDKLLLECGVRFIKDISNQNFLYDSEDNSRKITRQFVDEYNKIKTNYFSKICPF